MLHHEEDEDRFSEEEKNAVFSNRISIDDPCAVLALNKDRINDAFNDIRDQCNRASTKEESMARELHHLTQVMPKILTPVQLKRGNGTKLDLGNGETCVLGEDIPAYQISTIDVYQEAMAARE